MKFLTILAVLITAAAAQDCAAKVAAIPACGRTCIDPEITAAGCTGPTDLKCICAKRSAIEPKAAACVVKGCPAADTLKVQPAVADVCACVGA
ncbi:hypothetical protein EJ06DRAFT_533463 [Trichodelitschia bisporula]|uniref:CFEM domain-containing protein n=1 Tax=Trichodelitschia bisporula TaxID=703511 RepID=A0A6G1HN55_9PEZI|nr:hypothetical protein EJ06DRAFT_533463 [Trichodelitschia bisporula]